MPIPMSVRPPGWDKAREIEFQKWYRGISDKLHLDPNPDDPEHHYNYRMAWASGASYDPQSLHWPSVFKDATHPNRFIGGVDTSTMSVPTYGGGLMDLGSSGSLMRLLTSGK